MVARRIVIHGTVQGVGFRYWLRDAAKSRGVNGWVRNCRDGTVEAVVEGDGEAIDSLLRVCADGPRGAVVARVDVSDEAPSGLEGFAIH